MKSTCKSFWMILIYFIITQCSGVTIIAMWTVDIIRVPFMDMCLNICFYFALIFHKFQKSNSSVDANSGNVVLGITRLIGGVVTAVLIFRIRRRPMALVSGNLVLPDIYLIYKQTNRQQLMLSSSCQLRYSLEYCVLETIRIEEGKK